jgi:uncharacterized OsmC-like protein
MAANTETTEKKSDKTEDTRRFSISLDSIQDFEFRIKFDKTQLQDLIVDEPSPLGHDKGPDPAKLLASAVGGCLSASLLFSAQKLRLKMTGLHTNVHVSHTRNEKGRLRIGKVVVEIEPRIEEPDEQKLRRCLDMFEEFCVVTQSVRKGVDISVKVKT